MVSFYLNCRSIFILSVEKPIPWYGSIQGHLVLIRITWLICRVRWRLTRIDVQITWRNRWPSSNVPWTGIASHVGIIRVVRLLAWWGIVCAKVIWWRRRDWVRFAWIDCGDIIVWRFVRGVCIIFGFRWGCILTWIWFWGTLWRLWWFHEVWCLIN